VSDTFSTTRTESAATETEKTDDRWWRDAVVYQIYPRSFADGDGDGMGDFAGITSKVPYLSRLGVDAVWVSPFYVSPQRDAGYDVADYVDVDPRFGTLADVDAFIAVAHAAGIRVIVDLVPNHSSSAHPWFQAALASAPGSRERARYMFRRGSGPDASLPPNNWHSVFGGSAWEPVGDGDWYLHLFDPSQPDFDWSDPEVAEMFDGILRFWLDRGVDGFRVDVAHSLVKAEGLPDNTVMRDIQGAGGDRGPMWDQDGVHDIYRHWRGLLDEYTPPRILVAEAWVHPADRMARYVRADEMHQAFNFPYMLSGWSAPALRATIDESLAANHAVDATTTWVQSNHDVVRHATRFGQSDPTRWVNGIGPHDPQPDQQLGLRRARAIALLTLALPGSAYIYQGEELGLPDHTTLPADVRQDPTFIRTGGAEIGRDGCRVPLPWRADAPAFGFNETGASWLPQPAVFAELAADVQEGDPASTLSLYRSALRLRHERGLGRTTLEWHDSPATVLDADLGDLRMIVNTGSEPVALPEDARVLLASVPDAVTDGRLAGDAAVWLDLRG
jgi:alpha-glucosidase